MRRGEYTPVVQVSATPTTSTTAPLTVPVLERGHGGPRRGQHRLRVGLRRQRHGRLARGEPDVHLHAARDLRGDAAGDGTSGRSASNSVRIVIGNQAPRVTLTVVSNQPPFNFGDTVHFRVTVTDYQPVDCARVSVAYILGHDQHGHPQSSTAAARATSRSRSTRGTPARRTSRRCSWRATPTSPAAARRRSRAARRSSCDPLRPGSATEGRRRGGAPHRAQSSERWTACFQRAYWRSRSASSIRGSQRRSSAQRSRSSSWPARSRRPGRRRRRRRARSSRSPTGG